MDSKEWSNLTPVQKKVAECWTNPEFKFNKSAIARHCKVSSTSITKWFQNDEVFKAYIDQLIIHYVDESVSAVWDSLINQAVSGNVQAIKLFFELTGKYKQRVEISGQVTFIDDLNDDHIERAIADGVNTVLVNDDGMISRLPSDHGGLDAIDDGISD